MAINGSTILISVNTGTIAVPVWTVVPCQTSAEYALSASTIDTSCKDSGDNTNLPGARDRTISCEYNPASWPELATSPVGAEEVLRKAAETGVQVQARVMNGATPIEDMTGTITNYTLSAPREDKVTCSFELQVSGAPVPVP